MLPTNKNRTFGDRFFKRMRNPYYISFLLFLIVALVPYVTANWDPYEIIGVKRDANSDQIKKAYRELARKLHPDKSNLSEDEANRRFIELNKAFNILKDPDKRNRFDQHGHTEESRHSRGYHGHQYHNRQTWTSNGGPTFFFPSSDGHLRRKSISTKQYYNEYLKESKVRPFFIFFYSDFCPSCILIETAWTRITEELGKYNIGSFTINVHHESRLSQELGVNSIPHIACLIDGQIKSYYQSELSLANIVKFTKNVLPNNLATLLRTENEQDRFIFLGPQYNRLSAIIIHNENNLKLRYLLIAYELRHYYRFSHISTKLSNYLSLANKYNLSIDSGSRQTYLLVFDENVDEPIVNLNFNSDNLDMTQLKKQLTKWPFLQLPKLFSQTRFDDLCLYAIPRDGDKTKVRLCIILFATDVPSSMPMRGKLIEFIDLNKLSRDDRVIFSFIDPIKQSGFVTTLLAETGEKFPFKTDETIESAVIMIERNPHNNRKAHYQWLSAKWDSKKLDEIDRAKLELYDFIISYKRNHNVMQDKVGLSLLIDEEGPSLVDRVFWRFVDQMIRSIYYITSGESFSTVIILIICALSTSLFLYKSPSPSPMQSQSSFMQSNHQSPKQETGQNHETSTCSNMTDDGLKILELKAETYNGMIRLLRPGFRSIVLLIDRETKDKLLSEFKKAVWPYRRNKTLLFGYLCLDKNLNWYRSLLQEVLGVDNLNVNKKNCIGTVLSMNGFKKCFRVYHAKHHEIDYYDNETDNDGSFLGFNHDDDDNIENGTIPNSSSPETVYTADNLLDRLPIWLDKMFDGLTRRYFLDRWPEEMK